MVTSQLLVLLIFAGAHASSKKNIPKACGLGYDYRGIIASQTDYIVKEHNRLRNKVAEGNEPHGSPGPQPSASNMKALVWDDDLATEAQNWADQCTGGYDKHINIPKYSKVSQNMLLTTSCWMPANWNKTINAWFDGNRYWNQSDVGSYRYVHKAAAYTRMIWGETTAVGCGFTKSTVDFHCRELFVCNYGPGGNTEKERVYIEGNPRDSCPEAESHPEYPALC